MRKIITYSTLGENMKEINSSATTWGELQVDFARAGVSYEGMSAIEGESQVSFESSQARLPEGDFSVFLVPKKVKSGYEGSDDEYIDEEDGIRWNDVNWSEDEEHPEDYTFASLRDLAAARAKKALALLNKAISTLVGESNRARPSQNNQPRTEDPALRAMREQAAQLQKNLDFFN